MGDEGIGVHVVRCLQTKRLPDTVTCLDGGTGGLHLLGPVQQAERVILLDATIDGAPAGTVRRLCPRFSSDYPQTLSAHDIGLKDLLDALYLLGQPANITLFAISIDAIQQLGLEISTDLQARIPAVTRMIMDEIASRAPDVRKINQPCDGPGIPTSTDLF